MNNFDSLFIARLVKGLKGYTEVVISLARIERSKRLKQVLQIKTAKQALGKFQMP